MDQAASEQSKGKRDGAQGNGTQSPSPQGSRQEGRPRGTQEEDVRRCPGEAQGGARRDTQGGREDRRARAQGGREGNPEDNAKGSS